MNSIGMNTGGKAIPNTHTNKTIPAIKLVKLWAMDLYGRNIMIISNIRPLTQAATLTIIIKMSNGIIKKVT